MFSAMLSQNESKATIDALRPKVKKAVRELIRQRGLPKDFTGTIEYNGINIRVQRPRSYTWEHNYNPDVTGDPNHAIYLQQLELQKRMRATQGHACRCQAHSQETGGCTSRIRVHQARIHHRVRVAVLFLALSRRVRRSRCSVPGGIPPPLGSPT